MGGRRLADLRVLELRQELEKRGLDKSGIKAVLVERLTAALKKEGVDVDNFMVDLTEPSGAPGGAGDVGVKIEQEDETIDNPSDASLIIDEDHIRESSQSSAVDRQDSESQKVPAGQETISSDETAPSSTAAGDGEPEGAAVVTEKDEGKVTVEEPEAAEETDKNTVEATVEDTTKTVEIKEVTEESKTDVEQTQEVERKETDEKTVEETQKKSGGNDDTISSVLGDMEVIEVDSCESQKSESTEMKEGPPSTEMKTGREEIVDSSFAGSAVTEDDHDELHITIGEEEDKFIMDEGEEVKTDAGAKKQTSTVSKNETTVEIKIDQADSMEVQVEASDGGGIKSEAANNDALSSSNQAKSIDKSIEGRANRKLREENRDTLLVTGLSAETAATDLKNIFKKYGKIGGVKIMLSAKDPGASRFALVAVLASEDVETCIQKLDGHELHGRIIHVQKAGTDMLSADWSRKEGNRESGTKRSSSAISKTSSSKPATKSSEEESKAKRVKKSSDGTSSKTEPHRKSASEKSSASKDKDKKSASSRNTSEDKDKDKKKGESGKPSREKREGGRRGGKEFASRPFRGRMRGGFRDLPHHTQGGLRVRPKAPIPHRRDFGQMSGRRDFQRRIQNREGRDLIPRSPPRYRRQETESPRRGGRSELSFEDIYNIREREKAREVEREKREMERRRLEDEEKQAQLDLEIRQLAKQREKIELEKLELKRQKERMIMEEREKQRLERERIQREKEELQRRLEETRRLAASTKRSDLDFEMASERKKALDDRSRHRDSYVDAAFIEKEKLRQEPYRRAEIGRYAQISDDRQSRVDSPARVATVRSAPERDTRASAWAKDRLKSRERSPERSSHHREREPIDIRIDDRKSKLYGTQVVQLSGSSQANRYPVEPVSAHFSIPTATWTREVEPKVADNYSPNLRDNRWSQRSAPAYNADSHSSVLSSVRGDSWATRDSTWMQPERTATRNPIVDVQERWVGGSTLNTAGRSALPAAPPPPIYSGTSNASSLSNNHGGGQGSYNLGTRSYDYDYKLSSSGQRR